MARPARSRFFRLGFEYLEERTTPALFLVTNPSDSGPGTLRHQVAAANALPGPDLIRFQLPVTTPGPTTITLTTGEIAITDSLTVLGTNALSTTPTNAGPMINISGNQSSRIFNINGPGTLSVSLHGLGLKNGHSAASGGAILNVGENLSLHSCVLTGNSAGGNGGAIESVGAASGTTNTAGSNLNLHYSRLTANHATDGGAVHFSGPGGGMNAVYSTFDGNSSAQEGGAVSFATGGRFSFDSSTISNNHAGTSGGGLHYVGGPNLAPPGPVTNLHQLNVRNSTFSGNDAKVAGGAVALASFTSGALLVANSTVTHNAAGTNISTLASAGGGIHVAATSNTTPIGLVSLISTVLSGNNAIIGPDAFTPGKLSAAFSAVGNSAGIATFVNGGNNLPFGTDLKLAPLAGNGGPTQTHMPAVNSPLINHGSNPFGLRFDQRGAPFLRVQGPRADIGAVERSPTIAPPPGPNPISGGEDSDPTAVVLL